MGRAKNNVHLFYMAPLIQLSKQRYFPSITMLLIGLQYFHGACMGTWNTVQNLPPH